MVRCGWQYDQRGQHHEQVEPAPDREWDGASDDQQWDVLRWELRSFVCDGEYERGLETILSTFLAIQTFYAGARRIGAAQAALVSTVEPLIIVTLAGVFLGEVLAPVQLVGAGLILVGVLIAQTGERPRGAPEPAAPLEGELTPESSG